MFAGAAKDHYDEAVTSSIVEDWGGTAAEAATYLAKPAVAFDAATGKRALGHKNGLPFTTNRLKAGRSGEDLTFLL
jgi:CheY-specific phosphatase CheX